MKLFLASLTLLLICRQLSAEDFELPFDYPDGTYWYDIRKTEGLDKQTTLVTSYSTKDTITSTADSIFVKIQLIEVSRLQPDNLPLIELELMYAEFFKTNPIILQYSKGTHALVANFDSLVLKLMFYRDSYAHRQHDVDTRKILMAVRIDEMEVSRESRNLTFMYNNTFYNRKFSETKNVVGPSTYSMTKGVSSRTLRQDIAVALPDKGTAEANVLMVLDAKDRFSRFEFWTPNAQVPGLKNSVIIMKAKRGLR